MQQGIHVPIGDTFVIVHAADGRAAAEQVLDLLMEARKRGLNTPTLAAPTVNTNADLGIPAAWRTFVALLESGPEQATQTRLLYLLREHEGRSVERELLVESLELPVNDEKPKVVFNVLGGIVTGIVRKVRKAGLMDADVIERVTTGKNAHAVAYRAGKLVLTHPLPTVAEVPTR